MNQKIKVFSKKLGRLDIFKTISLSLVDRWLHKLALRHIKSNHPQVAIFAFDFVGSQINLHGVYEVEELDTFFEWIDTRLDLNFFDGVALDIGANIGNHSLYLAKRFNKVYSFEPNSRTFKVLKVNAELAPNIECFDFGLSNSDCEMSVQVDKSNLGGTTILHDNKVEAAQVINLRRLDSLSMTDGNVKIIKIDVEGHEYEALQGAKQLIKDNQPVILFEQHTRDFKNGVSKVIGLLEEYGYSRFATVRKFPRTPNTMITPVRWALNVLGRCVFGSEMRVLVERRPEPGFHTFIAALPDSFKLDSNTSHSQ